MAACNKRYIAKPASTPRVPGGSVSAPVPKSLIEGLRASAVKMGCLVPVEIEVVLTGLRRFQIIVLVVIADILAADVDLIKAISASGGQPELTEWPRSKVAIFVKFGQALLAEISRAIALRIVEEETSANFNSPVEPPIRYWLNGGRRLHRKVARQCCMPGTAQATLLSNALSTHFRTKPTCRFIAPHPQSQSTALTAATHRLPDCCCRAHSCGNSDRNDPSWFLD